MIVQRCELFMNLRLNVHLCELFLNVLTIATVAMYSITLWRFSVREPDVEFHESFGVSS
jgi:hypothetical protein